VGRIVSNGSHYDRKDVLRPHDLIHPSLQVGQSLPALSGLPWGFSEQCKRRDEASESEEGVGRLENVGCVDVVVVGVGSVVDLPNAQNEGVDVCWKKRPMQEVSTTQELAGEGSTYTLSRRAPRVPRSSSSPQTSSART
jgi:hypothetical protein